MTNTQKVTIARVPDSSMVGKILTEDELKANPWYYFSGTPACSDSESVRLWKTNTYTVGNYGGNAPIYHGGYIFSNHLQYKAYPTDDRTIKKENSTVDGDPIKLSVYFQHGSKLLTLEVPVVEQVRYCTKTEDNPY